MKRFLRLLPIIFSSMMLLSCREKTPEIPNPFFESVWTTPFGVPPFDSIRTEHFLPAFERGMSLHNEEIAAIVENPDAPTFENTVLAYDNAGKMLRRAELVFGMLAESNSTPQMQAVEEEAMPLLTAHADEIRMNERLFDRIRQVHDRCDSTLLTPEQMRLTEKIYDEFVRSGALLDKEGKKRLKEINGELARLSVRYGSNLLAETDGFRLELKAEQLDGVPSTVRDAARDRAREAGLNDKTYLFTLHKPSMLPFLTYAKDRKLREELYTAYLNQIAEDQENDRETPYPADNSWDKLMAPGRTAEGYSESMRTRFQDVLQTKKDRYKRYRDMMYIVCAGIYAIQIIDAVVFAHFYDFEINEDLSMKVSPSAGFSPVCGGTVGLTLSFKF